MDTDISALILTYAHQHTHIDMYVCIDICVGLCTPTRTHIYAHRIYRDTGTERYTCIHSQVLVYTTRRREHRTAFLRKTSTVSRTTGQDRALPGRMRDAIFWSVDGLRTVTYLLVQDGPSHGLGHAQSNRGMFSITLRSTQF